MMEETEYKDNERVLDKFKVKLTDKTEEVDCIVTESHLIIEADEVIRLPLSHIVNCDVQLSLADTMYSSQPPKQHSGTVTLTYLDELNNKQELSLEMSTGSPYLLKETIIHPKPKSKHIEPIKESRRHFRIAFFTTLSPNIIMTLIVMFNSPLYGRPAWINDFWYIQAYYWVVTVFVAMVFVFLSLRFSHLKKITKGIGLGSFIGLFLVLFSGSCLL